MLPCRSLSHQLGVAGVNRTFGAKPCRHNPPLAHEPRLHTPHACERRTPVTDVES
jgi:hypothetical protein